MSSPLQLKQLNVHIPLTHSTQSNLGSLLLF